MTQSTQTPTKSSLPLWQVLLLVVIAGAVIYGVIYGVMMRKGNQVYAPTAQDLSAPAAGVPSDNIYLTKTDPTKGAYVADFQGMTLYTFDKDTEGVSNCSGGCAKLWPAYTSGATAQLKFPAHIAVMTRADGSKQFVWDGKPLYYYAPDQKAGDLNGDGVGGVWHIVKP